MSEHNTCGDCEYYDQHRDGMFCKNQHNMLMAHGEVRILDTTIACDNFEPRLPANHNARLLFLAEKHAEDPVIGAAVRGIKYSQVELQGALQQSSFLIAKFESMSEMKPGYVFCGFNPTSFTCLSELAILYRSIRDWFDLLARRLETLGEDVSFF